MTTQNQQEALVQFVWNLQKYAKKVHETAVAHGWWDKDRDDAISIALMHSELSEAWTGRGSQDEHLPQHQSVAVEMADTLIRILDTSEKRGYRTVELVKTLWGNTDPEEWDCMQESLLDIHARLSKTLEGLRKPGPSKDYPNYTMVEDGLATTVIGILDFALEFGIDIVPAFHDKAEYNKSRPYRHGNKAF